MKKIEKVKVEVVYANTLEQRLIEVILPVGSTIQEAIFASKIKDLFPEIDLTRQKVGIFSKQKELTDIVAEGDRIEIYRPLLIDPKEARRLRAICKINCGVIHKS